MRKTIRPDSISNFESKIGQNTERIYHSGSNTNRKLSDIDPNIFSLHSARSKDGSKTLREKSTTIENDRYNQDANLQTSKENLRSPINNPRIMEFQTTDRK
jgi:hypothetical protein